MSKCKHERFILNLLIERTLFVYNIVLSNQFNITKRFKNKCIRLLVEIQKYLIKLKYQKYYDTKTQKYYFDQYKNLMNRLDYLFELFDKINGSEDIKNIWLKNLKNYSDDNEMIPGLYYSNREKNYIVDFSNYFIKLNNVKSLKTCKCNKCFNEFYLL